MSHGDAVTIATGGFEVGGQQRGAPVAAFEARDRRLAGVAVPPEVMHTPQGSRCSAGFCMTSPDRRQVAPANIANALIEQVRAQIGDGHAICGLSGGSIPR